MTSQDIASFPPESTHVPRLELSNRFRCKECPKSFGRLEHLTRHSLTHTRERTFKCSRCLKAFHRSDALLRHERAHDLALEPSNGGSSRACIGCFNGRRKCDRASPCNGCTRRSITCVYPAGTEANELKGPQASHLSFGKDVGNDQPVNVGSAVGDETSPSPWPESAATPAEAGAILAYSDSSPLHSNIDLTARHEGPAEVEPTQGPGSATFGNTVPELHHDGPLPQSQWRSSTNAIGYRENWLEQNFFSVNWIPDDWNPALEFEQFDVEDQGGHRNLIDSTQLLAQAITPSNSANSEIATSSLSQTSTGRLYVDSDGARLPHIRRTLSAYDESSVQEANFRQLRTQRIFCFPPVEESHGSVDLTELETAQISQETYEQICDTFQSQCVTSNHFLPYSTSVFPSIIILTKYIQLYLLNVHPVVPFINIALFKAISAHWLLILALSALGSVHHDCGVTEGRQCTLALLEFLRRAILTFEEKGENAKSKSYLLTQVKLLSCIGSMYCGNAHLLASAKANHFSLVQYCLKEWSNLSTSERSIKDLSAMNEEPELEWKTWCEQESCRRLGYSIWLVDCMWVFHFDTRSLLSLEDATVTVPCQEALWEAKSPKEWKQLYGVSKESSLSLQSIMQILYLEKELKFPLGEFSRILCIHALFHQTWRVENYFQSHLTTWNPTTDRQSVENIQRTDTPWPPGIPVYSNWRNSACDVLDILHWHANSVIGAASGIEHPTVLHLHLARVILLTPFQEIVDLADQLIYQRDNKTDPGLLQSLKKRVRRWALDDQYKARLAIIHAGVLFWHVRRYSFDAFYEPSAVYLATLALWAYATFAPNTPLPNSADESNHIPDYIQLDRPADDEIVQFFVRRGSVMKAQISGVGNLCSKAGPKKVLSEGYRLLRGLRRWDIARVLGFNLSEMIDGSELNLGVLGTN